MANVRHMAATLRKLRAENKQLKTMLGMCHEVNILRMNALHEAGIPDPVNQEEEE